MGSRNAAGQSGVSSPQHRRQRIKLPVADILLLGNSVSNVTVVSQAKAMPGDFALYPDASHVGLIVGRNVAGQLLVCHCSSGMNNVVVVEFAVSRFTAVEQQVFVKHKRKGQYHPL